MDKVCNYLGLVKRAGKLVAGTDAVLKNLNKKQIKLIFVASDSSLSTIDKVEKKAFFYQITVIKKYSTEEIGTSIGSNNPKVIGITDTGFTKAIKVELERKGD